MTNPQKITNAIQVPNHNLAVLKKQFPQCFDKEGKFLLEKFQENLQQNEINFSTESYSLHWLGKSYARLLASDPATTLLKTTHPHNALPQNQNAQNLLIKGDNLEVLKHLTNAYYEQVKMIYIDPPYNTGSDGFVYNDDRKFTNQELQNLIGVNAEKAKRILDFTTANSNSHSAWLTFMYPRLYVAKQLLKDDGVIFISIDDNEVAQLRLLMDEVFGEENFVAEFVWQKNFAPKNDNKFISTSNESIIHFAKNKELYKRNLLGREDKHNKDYKNPDNDPNGDWTSGSILATSFSQSGVFEITAPNGSAHLPPDGRCWRFSLDRINQFIAENKMWFGVDGKGVPRVKRYLNEMPDGIVPQTWLDYKLVGSGQDGTQDLKKIFNGSLFFDFPKPTKLINHLIKIGSTPSDLILDFFAGSGTTGDAVMQLNAEDGGNRKFILVQLPEAIDPKKNKAAYDFVKNELHAEPTIFEITKERLLRAANKINAGIDQKIQQLAKELPTPETEAELKKLAHAHAQNTFKIIETTPIWDDYDFDAEEFNPTQTLFDTSKLTHEDLSALLTTWKTYDGIALTHNLETVDLNGYSAHYGNGRLYLMHNGFSTNNLQALLEKIDMDKHFDPKSIIAFGYHFESARLRELTENVKTYNNKKKSDIDFITRY
ncbi:MAG: site-specific DNA-methyltransferase [Bacteroidia bacterium]